jgi:hypothetical protein
MTDNPQMTPEEVKTKEAVRIVRKYLAGTEICKVGGDGVMIKNTKQAINHLLFFALRSIEENKRLREALKQLLFIVIKTHPHSTEFREQLHSGELERRLEIMGGAFDPIGKVKAVLDAKAALAQSDEKGEQ